MLFDQAAKAVGADSRTRWILDTLEIAARKAIGNAKAQAILAPSPKKISPARSAKVRSQRETASRSTAGGRVRKKSRNAD